MSHALPPSLPHSLTHSLPHSLTYSLISMLHTGEACRLPPTCNKCGRYTDYRHQNLPCPPLLPPHPTLAIACAADYDNLFGTLK